MEKPIRVCVLSENRLFREALSRILSKKNHIETVRSLQLGPGAIEALINSGTNVLVLDSTQFLCTEGSRLSDYSKGRQIKIVIVAMNEDKTQFLEAISHGVCGYVPKEASAIELVNAIRAVADGEAVCPPRLCKFLFDFVAQIVNGISYPPRNRIEDLTRRERQLVPLIDRGLTNKEIAVHLSVSEKTVKNHIHRILRKLGAESRLNIAALCRASVHPAENSLHESFGSPFSGAS